MPTVYLITGANRGLGFYITSLLATRPDTVIYAGVRDPAKATDLQALAGSNSRIRVVKLEATSEAEHQAVVEQIKGREGKVDVVLANAGITLGWSPMRNQTLDQFRQHFEVNTLGVVVCYQAFRPHMSPGGVFAISSTIAGQLSVDMGFPMGSYGTSKAAANHIIARIGYEDKEIVALAIHPGLVATDMGYAATAQFGMKPQDLGGITPEESAKAYVKIFDDALGGKEVPRFVSYTGEALPW